MLPPFLIGTVFVVLMFQGNILIALYKNLNLSMVPIKGILQFVLFKTPEFLTLTLPIGAGLASSLALSRIVRESELTAMRAAGTPIRRILFPVLVMGLIVSILNWFCAEKGRTNQLSAGSDDRERNGCLGLAAHIQVKCCSEP